MDIRVVGVSDEAMPAGRQVVVAEGDHEVVLQVPEDQCTPLLRAALSATLTAYGRSHWVHVGDVAYDRHPQRRPA